MIPIIRYTNADFKRHLLGNQTQYDCLARMKTITSPKQAVEPKMAHLNILYLVVCLIKWA
ncbi:MAG: hypothetical protein CL679_01475 [Bermanella sp.]|nr:hypothetical protein [Bermanella sp.]